MKNISGIFVNKVIHNFKYIATGIKTGEKELVVKVFKEAVKQRACKSRTNINFSNVVFKCGLMEYIVDNHTLDCIAGIANEQG